jgi:hypothetical protein
MKNLSAFDDFVNSTLSTMPNGLERLEFVAKMKAPEGYAHWGLERVHGKAAAQSAIATAHADIFEGVVITPISELADAGSRISTALCDDPGRATPTDLRGCSPRHFNWILRVLNLLDK